MKTTIPVQAPAADVLTEQGVELTVRATGDVAHDTVELQQACARARDGARIRIVGSRLVLGSMAELRGLRDVALVCDRALTIVLAPVAWADPAAIVFRDCSDYAVLGWPSIDCNYQPVPAIAAISSDPDGWSELGHASSRRFFAQVRLQNCATRGLAVRLVHDVVLDRLEVRGKAPASHGVELARVSKVRVLEPNIEGGNGPGLLEVYGSGLVVSPGGTAGEFDTTPSLAFLCPTTFFETLHWTAPRGVMRWSQVSFSVERPVYPAGTDFSRHSWFFICTERPAGARDITRGMVRVSDIDSTARTMALSLYPGPRSDTPLPWEGQTIYGYGLRTDRMCHDVQILGGSVRDCAGAGVFLHGCAYALISGLSTGENRDIGYDLEWCRMSGMVDCSDDSIPNGRNSSGAMVACLEDCYADNCRGMAPFTIAGEGTVMGGLSISRSSSMPISMFPSGHSGTTPVLVDGLTIEGATITDAAFGIFLEPGPIDPDGHVRQAVSGALRRLVIRNVRFRNIAHSCIRFGQVRTALIEGVQAVKVGDTLLRISGEGDGSGEIAVRAAQVSDMGSSNMALPLVWFDGTGREPSLSIADASIVETRPAPGVQARPLYARNPGFQQLLVAN